jgi:hypothetical protein
MADTGEHGVYIKLVGPGKDEVEGYALPIESIQHTISRNPIVFPVPGVNAGTTGEPVIFGLDFGMMSETISFSGLLKDNELDPNVPTHQELAAAARTWWRYLSMSCGALGTANPNKIKVKEGAGQGGPYVYGGVIQSATFQREGGKLWWSYKLTFQITSPPTVDPAWDNPPAPQW